MFPLLFVLFSGLSIKVSTRSSSQKKCTKSNPRKCHVVTKVIIRNKGYALSKLSVILPYPKTNQYQNISNYKLHGGEILSNGNDQYVRFTLRNHAPSIGKTQTFTVEYDAETYDVCSPIIKESKPAVAPLKRANVFSDYLGNSGVQIDLKNSIIVSNAERIWKETKGDLYQYAKKCYQYVASSYRYCKPNTGLYPLHSLMTNGGGDCGNLSSIFISLLRYKNIPARHLVGAVAGAGFHVWSDFFLEGYGWIPVDVTFKNGNPDLDYFGELMSDRRIIFNRNINQLYFKEPGDSYQGTLLQNYHWWIWGEGDASKITSDYKISITPV